MNIRRITECDKEIYIKMSQDFFDSDATLFPITTTQLISTFNEAINGCPSLEILIMEKDTTIVGYGLLALYWSNEAGGMVTQLEEFYVLPQFRGNSYGSKFMEWLLLTYGDKSARFRLEACRGNLAAQKLYKSFGFEILDYVQFIRK